jgi:DNA-binding transcriptional ArsR family regulator
MYHTITRRAFAVAVALLVTCSFVAAPVVAVTGYGNGLETLDGDGSADDSTPHSDGGSEAEGSHGDGADGEDSDGEEDDAETDRSDDSDGADDADAERDDEAADSDAADDEAAEPGDRRMSEGANGTGEDRVDEVNDDLEATVVGVEEPTTKALEEVNETAVGSSGDVGAPLEGFGTDGLDVVELVGSLDVDVPDTDDGATTATRTDEPGADGEHEPVPAESMEVRPAASDDAVEENEGGDEDEDGSPGPSDPGGAVVGFGTVATAVALRGEPVVTGRKRVASGWLTALLDRVPPFLVPLRYSRYDDSDPLEHDARERVYDIVNETPGSYLSEVSEEADLPLSTTRHHIKVLQREDLVTGAKLHGKRRFYPAYAEGIELAAALNDESTATIIRAIARVGAASVSDLADELGRDPSTVSHHLQRLEEDGIVTRERDGRTVVNRLTAEARTALEPEATPGGSETSELVAGGAD